MASRRSRRAAAAAAFPALPEGIQKGLRRLVSDNDATVAAMLDLTLDTTDSVVDLLCEKCAQVMKQQQLSASSFLARFFTSEVLSKHAVLLNKSGKGSESTLGDRIAGEWVKNKPILLHEVVDSKKDTIEKPTDNVKQSSKKKRKKQPSDEDDEAKEVESLKDVPNKKEKKQSKTKA